MPPLCCSLSLQTKTIVGRRQLKSPRQDARDRFSLSHARHAHALVVSSLRRAARAWCDARAWKSARGGSWRDGGDHPSPTTTLSRDRWFLRALRSNSCATAVLSPREGILSGGGGAGPEIQWALPAQVRTLPIAFYAKQRMPHRRVSGLVVEWLPATESARVRFVRLHVKEGTYVKGRFQGSEKP